MNQRIDYRHCNEYYACSKKDRKNLKHFNRETLLGYLGYSY
jgi:hypothetical protein